MAKKATILCVDDEPSVGVVLEDALGRMGHTPLLASSVDEAIEVVGRTPVDLILADYRMPGATGLDLLATLRRSGFETPVIMLTGYASIEHAVDAIKGGAIDYLTKPVRPETLEVAVQQALELFRLRRENEELKNEFKLYRGKQIVGNSPALSRVLELIAAVAPTKATVLLEGESGTGKELFARAIHDQSPRRDGPFITLNCAAMPEGLVESALFGHEKGAFTGATSRAAGAFERAHGGSLLLDEISEMRLDLQAKLLRVIQEQQFERVGGQSPVSVDVRIIATTNRVLKEAVTGGTFREDLYYRLCVMPIRTPPLRERLDDLSHLAQHFVRRSAAELGVQPPELTPAALAMLGQHTWPGNIRELANVVERAVILARDKKLTPDAFDFGRFGSTQTTGDRQAPAKAGTDSPPPPPTSIPPNVFNLDEIERIMIAKALEATAGNRTKASGLLGISERTLRNKLNTKKKSATSSS